MSVHVTAGGAAFGDTALVLLFGDFRRACPGADINFLIHNVLYNFRQKLVNQHTSVRLERNIGMIENSTSDDTSENLSQFTARAVFCDNLSYQSVILLTP